jgi:branched-chain amino acid transport system ATP-binding protein
MALLQLVGTVKTFGGLQAVDHLNMDVKKGEILGLIGPNGAGKTTVFNLITGFLQPNKGDILFNGSSVLGLKPHDICELGITRTFQIVKPFAGLTVLENVMVGSFHLTKNSMRARKEAVEILNFLKIDHLRNIKSGTLTIYDRKRLEIARALAVKPKLLLLDEPMAGVSPAEANNMLVQVQKVRDGGISLLIIEHVMKVVMSISDRIVVLNHGQKIAEGSPEEVSTNPDVIAAYLGEEYLAS